MEYSDSLLFWVLAVAGVILTGISKSGFAGGAGVVAVPLLSLVMPVQHAAVLLLPILIAMDAKTVYLNRASIDFQVIRPIVIASLFGIAIAGIAMAVISSSILQVVLALFCIAFAIWHRLIPMLGKMPGAEYLWGSVSGLSSTLLHAGGPPITIYFLSKGISKKVWIAQAAIFFSFMNLVKVIPYQLNGLWDLHYFMVSLILIPVALVGVYIGHRIQAFISEDAFILSCRTLLGLTGVALLMESL